ncbi:hypothetical protein GDO81_019758 [Engystomops pustulosus]|uniref:Uncharacterized protein n=1 Tax=Engystomops pustulosus TaxID=76066 RepID=A0AAV6Z1P5_ENGPU|nr:hypothetical protein GDO81_019758 [Engystomops pustulosus]
MSTMRPRTRDTCGSQLENLVLNNCGACSKTLWSNGLDGGRGGHCLAGALATLPRGHKKVMKSRSNSLVDSEETEPNRSVHLSV